MSGDTFWLLVAGEETDEDLGTERTITAVAQPSERESNHPEKKGRGRAGGPLKFE